MKGKGLFITISVSMTVLVLLLVFQPKEVVWVKTFLMDDTNPYGSKILYDWIQERNENNVAINKKAYSEFREKHARPDVYIIITDNLEVSDSSTRDLLADVRAGLTLCIAAEGLHEELADSLQIQTRYSFERESLSFSNDSMRFKPADIYKTNPSVVIYEKEDSNAEENEETDTTTAGANTEEYDETAHDSIWTRVYEIDSSRVVVAERQYGKGKVVLVSYPELFTNIAMLDIGSARNTVAILSFLPKGKTVWDEHYKPAVTHKKKALGIIEDYPGLRYAYWLVIIGSVVFYVVYSRRRQRPIPVVEPLANSSLNLVRNMSALYWSKRDNLDIVLKMQRLFKEYCSRVLRISPEKEDAAKYIAAASSNSIEDVELLMRTFDELKSYKDVSDSQLEAIDKQLLAFYSKSGTQF